MIGIWNAALRFVKMFLNTRTPSSVIWLLEILFLLSVKYIPKELLGDAKFKKELHETINFLLLSCANVCSKNFQIFFNEPNSDTQGRFKMIFPLPPTIYEMYKQYNEDTTSNVVVTKDTNENGQEYEETVQDHIIEKMMFDKIEKDYSEYSLYTRYRLFCFKTLKRVALNLIQNTYAADRVDRVAKRVNMLNQITVIYYVCLDERVHGDYFPCYGEQKSR